MPTLRIGFHQPFEPFGFMEGERATGWLVELVSATLLHGAAAHRFVPLPIARAGEALLAGEVDALAYQGVTPARQAEMDFSDPLVQTGAALFLPQPAAPAMSLDALRGKRIATPKAGPLYAEIMRSHPDISVLDGVSYPDSFRAVLEGRADAAALNFQAGLRLARQSFAGKFALPEAPYATLPLALAVAKGRRPVLLQTFNQSLAALRASGAADELERRWLGGGDAASETA